MTWSVLARRLVAACLAPLASLPLAHAFQGGPAPGTLTETAELVAPDALPGDLVGWGLAADGDTIVMGSWVTPGAAYVFVRNGPAWDLQAKLVPQGATHGFGFGTQAALDGDTLVLGAAGEDLQGGAFYVFERTGSAWDAGQRYKIPNTSGVGAAVDIEGDRMAVGASYDVSSHGAVFVLARTGAGWVVEHKLTADDPSGIEGLGSSLALQGDRLLAGAPRASDGGPSSGRAYLFTFDGASWSQQAKLAPAELAANSYFGGAVAIDGERLAVGAPAYEAPPIGAVYVYTLESGSPQQQAKLTSLTGNPLDRFGSALALEDDRLVVGAHQAGGGTGAAYVFERQGNGWNPTFQLVPLALDPGSRFGLSIAKSGSDLVVGAPYGSPAGSAFVFDLPPAPTTFHYCLATPNSTGLPCSMGSQGSTSIAADEFVLSASNAPPLKTALFLCGPNPAQLPFGPGYLCISPFYPGVTRLVPGLQADAAGFVQRSLDFDSLPASCSIEPGSTWYFQAWYRDATPSGFNLSDGLGATFTP